MKRSILSAGFSLLLSGQAFALGAIVHLQGEKGDREAFFADVRIIWDRTPVDQMFGPTSIKEIDVTAVYEHAVKPEWVTMRMQFECAAALAIDSKSKPKRLRANDPVKFRIGPGSYLVRRSDLKTEPMQESVWQTSSAPMLMKAGRIACNEDEFEQAIRKSIRIPDPFDYDAFGKAIAELDLPADMMLIGPAESNDFLDFSWSVLWWDTVAEGKRPDPSGKWSRLASKGEKEAAARKLEEMRKEAAPVLEQARKSLEGNIAQMQAEFEFKDRAASLRKDRKLNKFEQQLIPVWVGVSEADVVAAMGNPRLDEAGGQRFLHYTRVFDNTAQVVDMTSGATWEEGNYSECNVEFVTVPDHQKTWRVADTRVWIRENALGNGAAWCYGFLKAPK